MENILKGFLFCFYYVSQTEGRKKSLNAKDAMFTQSFAKFIFRNADEKAITQRFTEDAQRYTENKVNYRQRKTDKVLLPDNK